MDPFINTIESVRKRPCRKTHEGPCQPSFSFKHVLQLTEDVVKFTRKAENVSISSNIDNPEAGFDAIMQVAVCQVRYIWQS